MFILSGDSKQVVNTDFVERFCLVEHSDATLIVASYSDARKPVTLSKYATFAEARSTLDNLFTALVRGDTGYTFPLSKMFNEEKVIKDSRTKRRGGS